MKKRLLSVLAFALAVSAGAAFVLYQLIASKVKVGASTKQPTVKVFVASHDLELGALVQEKDVTTQEFLTPPSGAILKKEDVINRGVTTPIHQDAAFYEASLAPKGAGAGFAATIPKGMRAFAVHVNEVVGVAGFAVAGMRVDVLVSGSPPGASKEATGNVTRTLLQNIQVLSAGQNYQKDAEGKPVLVQVVNLLVTPAQAEILNLATEQAIQLVLRNPSDQEVVQTTGAATSNLFSGAIIKAPGPVVVASDQPRRAPAPRVIEVPPPPRPPQTVTIEVFQGSKRADSTFIDPDSVQGVRKVKKRIVDILFLAGLALCANSLRAEQVATAPAGAEQIVVGAGKTHLLDMPVNIERVSVATPEIAEAVPVSARSLMINGRSPGETSLVVWLNDGSRREYDVNVQIAPSRLVAAREQLAAEFGPEVKITVDNGAVYLTGRVPDLYASDRAVSIAGTMGRVVNLLKVNVPPQAQQILLKVRFANVDRSRASDLGINFFGAPQGFPFTATVGTFSPSTITGVTSSTLGGSGSGSSSSATLSLSDALNLLFSDPHLNLGATLKALQSQNVLQILAEPNVLAIDGKPASFIAGGEFPFPTLQGGGGGVGQVTIDFREYGIRIHFLPIVTPRGTIRLHVTPEVSSLDYANSLSVSGFTVPALATRRIDTEVELESGQSFAIAGLLDNNTTESLSKIPGLSSIPLFGKLFETRSVTKNNSELLVIVTPELVAPIAEGQALPDLPRPTPFLEGPGVLTQAPRTPATDVTGPAAPRPKRSEVPVQEMQRIERDLLAAGSATQVAATPQNPTQPITSGGDAPAAPAAAGGSSLRIGQ